MARYMIKVYERARLSIDLRAVTPVRHVVSLTSPQRLHLKGRKIQINVVCVYAHVQRCDTAVMTVTICGIVVIVVVVITRSTTTTTIVLTRIVIYTRQRMR